MLLPRERSHLVVLLLCAVGVWLHQWWMWPWYIEDAAISYAYARNLVAGEGLVPWPGAERVEGFSNPTWVALIALFELVGIDGFTSTKWMGLLFAAACVPFTYALARASLPGEARHYALVAPVVLAVTSMFAIWSTCGLENSLFCFLLIGGVWQLVREMRWGGRPWSAVWFVLLALSRPDGLLYAAVAGLWFLVAVVREKRGWQPVAQWLAVFWAPYLLVVAARLWYFAWPLPMTYYGKVGGGGTVLHKWYGWGWTQLRGYCIELGQVAFLPVYLFGLSLARDWRGVLTAALVGLLGLHLLVPGPEWLQATSFWPELPEPLWWLRLRVLGVGVIAVVLPAVAIGAPRWEPRVTCGAMAITSVFFHLYSNADWMIGYRWMSFLAPTSAVLFAVGGYELAALLQRRLPPIPVPDRLIAPLVGVALFAYAVPNVLYTGWYWSTGKSEDPFLIQRRAVFTTWLWRRTQHHDKPMINMDHDMGGHMFWYGDTYRMVDVASLVDVPMAMHNYSQRAFVEEYVFREKRPHVIHLNKNWEGWTAFHSYEAFRNEWFPLPPWNGPYDQHVSFWIRRDLFMRKAWRHPVDRKVNFGGGASLQGFDLPTREIGRGRAWYLEAGFKTVPRKPGEAFRVVAFLARGKQLVTWDVPLGFGILPMHRWRADEVFVGRFTFELPPEVPEGVYDLGFVVIGPDGVVLPAGGWKSEAHVAPGARVVKRGGDERPRYAWGEVVFPGAVTVVANERVDALAEQHRLRALELAYAAECAAAEEAWLRAQRQVPRFYDWQAEHRPEIGHALSRCWTLRAEQEPGRRVDHLARAHTWDHREPSFLDAARAVADELYAAGLAARERGDPAAAYALFSDVLRVDPTRSWARRYAEEARDQRLGLSSLSPLGRVVREYPKAKED